MSYCRTGDIGRYAKQRTLCSQFDATSARRATAAVAGTGCLHCRLRAGRKSNSRWMRAPGPAGVAATGLQLLVNSALLASRPSSTTIVNATATRAIHTASTVA